MDRISLNKYVLTLIVVPINYYPLRIIVSQSKSFIYNKMLKVLCYFLLSACAAEVIRISLKVPFHT